MKKHSYKDPLYDTGYDDYEMDLADEETEIDSFADKIPYEMLGYASDRYTDDELEEDLIQIED